MQTTCYLFAAIYYRDYPMICSHETDFRRVPSLDHLMRIRKRRSPNDRPSYPPSVYRPSRPAAQVVSAAFFLLPRTGNSDDDIDGCGDNRFPISPRVHTATKTVCCRISNNPFKLWTRTSWFILPPEIVRTLLITQKKSATL